MSHLQAPDSPGRCLSLRSHAQLESNERSNSLSRSPANRSLALLWPPPASRLDANAAQPPKPAPAARAQTLPNPLPAHLLDNAHPLAFSRTHALHHHRAPRGGHDHRLLAKPTPFILALLGAAVRHRPPGPASYRL